MLTSHEPYLEIQARDGDVSSRLPAAPAVTATSQPYQYKRLKDDQTPFS